MKNKLLILTLLFLIFLFIVPGTALAASKETKEYGVDLAFDRRVVSTNHTDDNYNIKAVDANPQTRYASAEVDNAFFTSIWVL
ncbi:MAG: hypothetical protein PHV87_07575 [Bacilli bacterium]|nr:hypothetical protein [Bacilli bacterium]